MYCLVDTIDNIVCSWNENNNYVPQENQKVYEIDEYGENFLSKVSDNSIIFFDGEKWWTKARPRLIEEIDQDVEDMILLLAEILGTDNTEESDE